MVLPPARPECVASYKSSQLIKIVPQFLHTTLHRISSKSVDPHTTQTSGIPGVGGSSSPTGCSSGSLLKIESQVHRGRRVRERTDGYEVHAGLRDRPHIVEIHSS